MASVELVTILAGGQRWTAWHRISVERKFKDAALSFDITIAAELGPTATAWTFRAGTKVDIYFNADLACRGYVDRYKPSISERGKVEISVCGRSKSQDAIDSSAIHKTGNFKNLTPDAIGKALDKFGIGISTDQKLSKINYRLTPGETLWHCLNRMCRAQGVWASGQPAGNILLTIAGQSRNGPILHPGNFMSGDADHNHAGRHSHVIARGQKAAGHGKESLEIEDTATDTEVDRYRPVVVMQDDDTDQPRTKKRAEHRRDSEAGESLKANVKVQGFRDDAGKLWTPGFLTFLQSPFLDIAQDMAIESATYTQERDKGSETSLSLVDPRALGAKSGRKGGKANKAWNNSAGNPAVPHIG